MRHLFLRRITFALFLAAIGCLQMVLCSDGALAQNYGLGNEGWDQKLYYSSQLYTPSNPIEEPSREYTGLPVAGWIAYASVLTGVVWDDNVYQSHQFPTSSWGARISPSVSLDYNNGMHKTSIYGTLDARFYSGNNDNADVVNGNVGVNHTWEVERDFVVKGSFDFARRTDINNAGTLATPGGIVTIVDPQEYNQITTSVSGQKSWGHLFAALGGNYTRTDYDNITDSLGQTFNQDGRDENAYTISGRAGFWFSPVFYAFVEPSQNWRNFRDSGFNSDGQRVVAGIGSDRVSLFRGEIFAGYQQQSYDDQSVGTVSGNVYGGRLDWFPTRDAMFTLSVDKTLGDSTLPAPGDESGAPVESTAALLKSQYILSDVWSLSTQFGYSFNNYIDTTRRDNQWIAGTTVSYFVWRDLATTFDWQYTNVDSNIAANSFSRNIFTLGATYKY